MYGFEWDQGGEVVEMHPMRRAYPLVGSRLLLAAYAESLTQEEPIMTEEFVRRYAAHRFGLTPKEGAKLWQALTLDATPIQPGVDVESIHAKAQKARRLLAGLDPQRHVGEFEHLRLMADLREFHSRFKKLEAEIQSPRLSSAQLTQKSRALERLIRESHVLDARFITANKGFLYEKALLEETEARSKKLHKLFDRLTRAGRRSSGTRSGTTRRAERKWRWVGGIRAPVKAPPHVPTPLVAAE